MLSSLLHHTTACSMLRAGCQQLGLPDVAAVELVRFLSVKRYHDGLDRARRPRAMSPGTALDRLWHWMLLNTRVSTAVHELVGGVVEHVGTDEQDLADSTKMMQRLYAMSILMYEGWDPEVELWEDPGTCMQGIYLKGPAEGEDVPDVFVSQATTEQQYEELLDDMRVLLGGHSRQNGWWAPTATPTPTWVATASSARWQAAWQAAAEGSEAGSEGSEAGSEGSEAGSEGSEEGSEGNEAGSKHTAALPGGCVRQAADSQWTIFVLAEAHKDTTRRVCEIQATDSTTVRVLKRQLREQGMWGAGGGYSGQHLGSVRVFHCRQELQDHMLVPDEEGTWLRLVRPEEQDPSEQPTFKLDVKLTDGKITTLTECGPWTLVRELKNTINKVVYRGTFPADLMRTIWAGRQLDDDKTLEESGLQKDCTVHLVTRLRGC